MAAAAEHRSEDSRQGAEATSEIDRLPLRATSRERGEAAGGFIVCGRQTVGRARVKEGKHRYGGPRAITSAVISSRFRVSLLP